MKLSIDITDEMYQAVINGTWCGSELWYNALKNGIPQETVTEFVDRCRECGARYGRLLNQKWIPVSEGTPKEEETIIASTKYGVYPEARYTKEYGWEWAYESGADYWVELDDVEAWMPLPKRYEPEAEGGKS